MLLNTNINKSIKQIDNNIASSSKNINSIMNEQKQHNGDMSLNNSDK